ncbi:ribulokinase [Xaviernesmea oryzae]|uniref:Ribulokinase n=1 Tax=Xaviernesmea oryzae TaxID=464029 RepID=A0A1Q9B2S1_9HYPH|nr:FGGY-family carbohydrate kinase [Xaviernesmea oryzae]OLP62316.1 ribulokinase [Xaviernesmea oryzae]SEL96589.1 FGGY-family pentulose kinase [Xaviernesmea oryzae]
MNDRLVMAVDVGTGSARAGLFDLGGSLLARAEAPILMNRPDADHAEHQSEDIWKAVTLAVRAARETAGVAPEAVGALAFDATCSLVVRDGEGAPLSVNREGAPGWDTIVWLDHRAMAEADACTATGHRVLDFSGRVMSPEMEMPKLMWLKRHLPAQWAKAGLIFDLVDFLSWRATGSNSRSRCALTAKWNYLSHTENGWQADFLAMIGLDDLMARAGLPREVQAVGAPIGPLTAAAAEDLGLTTHCTVATGLIDAYAGALGVLGRYAAEPAKLERRLAMIAGTSSCLVAFSQTPKPLFGMWGPYYEAGFPGCWLIEGGQSVGGALLDHLVRSHSVGGVPDAETHGRVIRRIQELRAREGASLGARLNILPDFHGNRSPLADPHALGVISGLSLDSSFDGLCRLYWRACVAIALGIRHVLQAMIDGGYEVDTLHLTGGHVRNPLLTELYGDVTGCPLIIPETPDAVLLGTAMVAAVGGGFHADLGAAGLAMAPPERLRLPNLALKPDYDRDFGKFLAMQRHRAELDRL